MLPPRLPSILAAAVAVLLLAAGPAGAAQDAPCPERVRCTTVTVALDRSGVVAGTVPLHVGIVHAKRDRRPPVIALNGGPGGSTVPFAGEFADLLGTRSAGRDLVVLDARGTGWSGLVRCRAYEHALTPVNNPSASSCARELGPARSFYTAEDVAADIEAVRRRLGVPMIALYGVSYGTKLALEYARRYPQRTERVILDSIVDDEPPDAFFLSTLQAIPRVLHTVCSYGCGGERHPVADLRALASRLRADPLRRWVRDGRSRVLLEYTADDLLTTLVQTDNFVPLMQAFPIAVAEALKGRYATLIALSRAASSLLAGTTLREFSPGTYAAALCEESPVAWDRSAAPATRRAQALAALAALPDVAFGPFDRTAALNASVLPMCGHWPSPSRTRAPAPPLPGLPFLLLNGDLDLRTPLEAAERLAARLPDATLVREPGAGHAALFAGEGGCSIPAARRFLREQSLRRCRLTEELARASRSGWLGRSRRAPRTEVRAPLPGRG